MVVRNNISDARHDLDRSTRAFYASNNTHERRPTDPTYEPYF